MKACPRCNQMKPFDRFSKHKNRSDGLQSVCKDCELVYRRKTQRKSDLKRNFKLTLEEYDAKLASQGDGCAICGTSDRLTVDHDRKCCPSLDGKNARACGGCTRGILCTECNVRIGKFAEDQTALIEAGQFRAAEYLRSYSLRV
jgi:hypothetical protein